MNNEIKEILEQMKSIAITGKDKNGIKVDGYGLQQNELKMFLDYITNLQQRIEGLEAENETLRSDFKNQVEYTNKIAEENEKLKYKLKNKECLRNTRLDDDYVTIPKLKYKNITDLQIKTIKEKEDYKSRCEKAIELINKRKNEIEDLWVEMKTKDYFEECDEIINILQNGSDSQ